jgi:hypothetical protein
MSSLCDLYHTYSRRQLLTDYQPVPILDGPTVSIPESWSSDHKRVIGLV